MSRVFLAIALLGALTGRGLATSATDICAPNADPCVVSGNFTVAPGSLLDFGSRQLDIALGRLAFPAGPGEVCSQRVDLDLPAGKTKLLLKTEADTVAGFRDRDSLKLSCAP